MFQTETMKDKKKTSKILKFKITEPHLIKIEYFLVYFCVAKLFIKFKFYNV